MPGTAPLPAPPAAAPVAIGSWQLDGLVAEGSFSQVYRVRPAAASADRPAAYAMKVLRPEHEEDSQALALFRREAQAGRRIAHSHVIPVLDAAVQHPPRFLVMPLLEGCTLEDRLGRNGDGRRLRRPDPPEALWIARQAAEALTAFHREGFVHGDIKPANLFLNDALHVTLIDLGFARRAGGTAGEAVTMGTVRYMAPETLCRGHAADIRSDLYSLGVVLFEMLFGRHPFESDDPAELAAAHRTVRPRGQRGQAPHLDGALFSLLASLLAKEPLRRPQTPAELTERLAAAEIACFADRGLACCGLAAGWG